MGTRRAKAEPNAEPEAQPHVALASWLASNSGIFPTKAEFAAAIGCSPGRLSQILAGERPSPELAWAIEAATRTEIKAVRWFARPAGGVA